MVAGEALRPLAAEEARRCARTPSGEGLAHAHDSGSGMLFSGYAASSAVGILLQAKFSSIGHKTLASALIERSPVRKSVLKAKRCASVYRPGDGSDNTALYNSEAKSWMRSWKKRIYDETAITERVHGAPEGS